MGIQFKWLAHSTFMMELDGHPVLFDPFLTGNPLAAAEPGTLSPEFILLSHAHGDHVADALPIARRTNAHIVCNAEMSYWFNGKGYQHVTGGNTGGSIDFDFMRVKFTIAFHSSTFPDGSSGGSPNGFVITLRDSGLRLYYAGDTALYSDMSLIGRMGIDVAFLPIGDHFTMGIEDSLEAIRLIQPRYVVPMHYNTFPPIQQNGGEWANRVSSETESQPIVLDPGGVFNVS